MENAVFVVVVADGLAVVGGQSVAQFVVADVGSSVQLIAAAVVAAAAAALDLLLLLCLLLLVEVAEVPVMDRRSLAASFHPGMLLGLLRDRTVCWLLVLLLLSPMPRQLWHQKQQRTWMKPSMQVGARRLEELQPDDREEDAAERVHSRSSVKDDGERQADRLMPREDDLLMYFSCWSSTSTDLSKDDLVKDEDPVDEFSVLNSSTLSMALPKMKIDEISRCGVVMSSMACKPLGSSGLCYRVK